MDIQTAPAPHPSDATASCTVPCCEDAPDSDLVQPWIRYAVLKGVQDGRTSPWEPRSLGWVPYGSFGCDLLIDGDSIRSAAARYAEALWSRGRALSTGSRRLGSRPPEGEGQRARRALEFYERHRQVGEPMKRVLARMRAAAPAPRPLLIRDFAFSASGWDDPDPHPEGRSRKLSDFECAHRTFLADGDREHIALWPAPSLPAAAGLQRGLRIPWTPARGASGQTFGAFPSLEAYLRAYGEFARAHAPYLSLIRSLVSLDGMARVSQYDPFEDQDGVFFAEYDDFYALQDHLEAAPGEPGGARTAEEPGWGDFAWASFPSAFREYAEVQAVELTAEVSRYEREHPGTADAYFGAFDDPEGVLGSFSSFGGVISISAKPVRRWREERAARGDAGDRAGERDEGALGWDELKARQMRSFGAAHLMGTYAAEYLLRTVAVAEPPVESEYQLVDARDERGVWHRRSIAGLLTDARASWWSLGSFALTHPDAFPKPLLEVPAYRERIDRAISFARGAGVNGANLEPGSRLPR